MAGQAGAAMPALKDDLRARASSYSYFQAIRLLRRAGVSNIRVRPHLSLGFPDNDIERIERMRGAEAGGSQDAYRVTANFFGLYGVSSPLPTFYTEDLLDDEREGRHARRDFFDILHGSLYPQLFDAWRKYRLQIRVVEDQDPEALDTLYAFAGLGSAAQRESLAPEAGSLLRHLNLFAQRTRSVLGLQTLLADAFAPATVEVESCVPQWVPIPDDQRLRLGLQAHALGETCPLGMQLEDCDNLLRVVIGELPEALFQQLLPGAEGHRRLQFLVRFYLTRPLQVAVELKLRHDQGRTARLGAPVWSRLGLDTWLPGAPDVAAPAVGFRLAAPLISPPRTASHAAG